MTDTMTDDDLRLRLALAAAPVDPKKIDQRGAPVRVRVAVGNARTPEDRLSTLKRYYPDAEPYGDDNFIFTDPQTKRKTIYNPEGMDFGDIPSIGPEIAEGIGGFAGGAAAAASAPVTGGASLITVPAAAGVGAAGAREMYDLATKALIGTDDTRGVGTRVLDTAVTGGVNAIGTRVGDLVEKGGKALIGMIPRRNPVTGPSAITDFANAGVDPSAGAVTGNRATQMIEKGLSNTPGGARVMQEQAQRQLDQLAAEAERIANRMGPGGTAQEVGATIKQGAEAAGERFAARREVLDQALESAVGGTTPARIMPINRALQELETSLAAAPESRRGVLQAAIDRLRSIEADAANNGLDFRTLRQIRTDVGRELERPDVSGYSPAAEASMRRVYGALAESVRETAEAAGPQAQRALAVHDRYVRFNRNVNLLTLDKIDKLGLDEEAFRYAMSGTKDGGSRLLTLRRNLTPEEWDVVSSSAFSKLGRAKAAQQGATDLAAEPSEFSINTFLTNWNNLSPEARRALFAGTRYQGLNPEINGLVRVVERLKDTDKMANPSGTARNILIGLGVATAGGEAARGDLQEAGATMVGGVLAPRYAAKLMTSPRFINWLSGTVSATARQPESVGAHLGRLTAIAKAEPELREAIYGYLDAMRQAPGGQGSGTSPAEERPTP